MSASRARIDGGFIALCIALALCLVACSQSPAQSSASHARPTHAGARQPAREATHPPVLNLVDAAREQIGITNRYDPAYVVLAYPGGDVPQDRGVCTDVVIRALRAQKLDLQRSVHEDMRTNFARYPQKWGLPGPDGNIDHRRVPNLQTWFARQGWSIAPSGGRADDFRASDFRAGDLVTWLLPGNLPHIGIVSDRKSVFGTPLIIHNIGRGTREEDILFEYRITGHYRPKLPQ